MRGFLFIFIGLIIISTEWIDFCNAVDSKNILTKTEVRDLLLARTDFMNYQEIIDLGDRISYGLIEILKESENRLELERVILVIEGLDVDKKQFINPLTGFIKNNTKTESARSIAIQLLGTIAGKDVQDEVFSLLEDKEEFIRSNALRFLGKYGDASMADKIRQVLDERLSRTNPLMISKDLTFSEGEKAIEEIRNRSKKEQESGKDKKSDESTLINAVPLRINQEGKVSISQDKESEVKTIIQNTSTNNHQFSLLLIFAIAIMTVVGFSAVVYKTFRK